MFGSGDNLFTFNSDLTNGVCINKKTRYGSEYRSFVNPRDRDRNGSTVSKNDDKIVDNNRVNRILKKGVNYVDVEEDFDPRAVYYTEKEKSDFKQTVKNLVIPNALKRINEQQMELGSISGSNSNNNNNSNSSNNDDKKISNKTKIDASILNSVINDDALECINPRGYTINAGLFEDNRKNEEGKNNGGGGRDSKQEGDNSDIKKDFRKVGMSVKELFKAPKSFTEFAPGSLTDMFYYFPKTLPNDLIEKIKNHKYMQDLLIEYKPRMFSKIRKPERIDVFKDIAKHSGLFIIRDENINNDYCIIHCTFMQPHDDDLELERKHGRIVAHDIRGENLKDMDGKDLETFIEDVIRTFIIIRYEPGSLDRMNKLKPDAKFTFGTIIITMVVSLDVNEITTMK